nr:TIGR03089 family protein [Microlunatus panaciterrae]
MRARARTAGPDPLITYYDLGSGERTELSGVSFLNWVDKTSNWLLDEYTLDPGDVVRMALADAHPGHWVTLIWHAAIWQVGATVLIGDPVSIGAQGPAAGPSMTVLGPDWASADRSGAGAWVACALHPLGLGFAQRLPDDVVDYALEVRTQPDQHVPAPVRPDSRAWLQQGRHLSQAELVVAASGGPPARRLVQPTEAWQGALEGLLRPVLTGGSAVIVVGADEAAPDRLDRIIETERVG